MPSLLSEDMFHNVTHVCQNKQGVALTGCNTTGPPCSVTVMLKLDWRQHDVIAWSAQVKPPASLPWSVTDDDDRCQRAKQYWPPTLCV